MSEGGDEFKVTQSGGEFGEGDNVEGGKLQSEKTLLHNRDYENPFEVMLSVCFLITAYSMQC